MEKVFPPLEAAGYRLERLLGGGSNNINNNNNNKGGGTALSSSTTTTTTTHSNPSKVVRRWLGTSSGTASRATLLDLSNAASSLLDPEGSCANGRTLLMKLSSSSSSEAMDVDQPEKKEKEEEEKSEEKKGNYLSLAAREVESWMITLAVRILISQSTSSSEKTSNKAFALADEGIAIIESHLTQSTRVGINNNNNNTTTTTTGLFPLLARMYRYRGLAAEQELGTMEASKAFLISADLHADMVRAHRAACLRRDVDTQATLLNLMLRDLLTSHQVEQAQKLLSNSTFPDSASNNQLCRYLYHSGRIQALRLEYTSAFSNLSQCLRKAPSNTGLGFRIAAQRLLVVVQLLMGEIPDRAIFYTPGMKTELGPYMKIAQAVRRGDLAYFHQTVSDCVDRLRSDGTHTLISRLAHSVVKAGLRRLNASYSRISLDDVASRLGLSNATTAEYVVAKAVRDGVIDATIDKAGRFVQSHDLVDVYATVEPAEAFHRRIAYCLATHNDAVRGMRYPPDEYKRQLEASRGGLRGSGGKDDDKTDEEKAQELEDELDDEY